MSSWIPFMPERASTFAWRVDALYFYLLGVTVIFSLLIAGLIFYFAVKYRRREPDEIPAPIEGSLKLEAAWTVIPFLIATSMFVWGASVYFSQYRVPADVMELYVVGKQWMWKIQHIEGQREINELHVPIGRKVKLTLASEDVIHSFFVPAFRIKHDVVPGRFSTIWFEATQTGRYHLFCAEYCGTNHSGMTGWVHVMEPADYENWLSGGAAEGSMASLGEKLFQNLGCNTCHRSDTQGRGPVLAGLFGREQIMQSGETVLADEAYIRESILNPRAKVLQGFQPIMPTFQGQVNEEQVLQLIAYIRSIGAPAEPAQPSGAALPARAPAGRRPAGQPDRKNK